MSKPRVMIRLWKFDAAPKRYQNLALQVGAAGWIAEIPKELWPEETPTFWRDLCPNAVSEHKVGQFFVIVGAP